MVVVVVVNFFFFSSDAAATNFFFFIFQLCIFFTFLFCWDQLISFLFCFFFFSFPGLVFFTGAMTVFAAEIVWLSMSTNELGLRKDGFEKTDHEERE